MAKIRCNQCGGMIENSWHNVNNKCYCKDCKEHLRVLFSQQIGRRERDSNMDLVLSILNTLVNAVLLFTVRKEVAPPKAADDLSSQIFDTMRTIDSIYNDKQV